MVISILLFLLSVAFLLAKSEAINAFGLMFLPVSVSAGSSSIVSYALLKGLSILVVSIGSMANDLTAMRPKEAEQSKQSPNLIHI